MKTTKQQALREKAQLLWQKYRCSGKRPLAKERGTLIEAYWANALPTDRNFSAEQWVEDGFPGF
jgi:hypothetical protein